MSILLITLLVLLLAAVAVLLVGLRQREDAAAPADVVAAAEPTAQPPSTQRPSTQPPTTQPPTTQPPTTQPPTTQPPTTQPAAAAAALPQALRAFRPVVHERLPADQVATLVQRLAQIPPPPLALHKLVSAEFLEAARPTALAETIMAEAQIAARLLATVNAPKYGLRKPVGSVVQAVSLLGLNTVRSLCLQHLLHNSFAGAGPAHRQRLDRLLRASTGASALCGRLAAALGLAEPGALVTQTVLSHLGQLATTVLLQPGTAAWGPHSSLLSRLDAEQQALGLASGEVGALLMQAWGLPASIVAEVRDIDRPLYTPAHLVDPRQAPRLALCYLSARLGERLAGGQIGDTADGQTSALAHLRLDDPDDPDFCHLGSYLALPALARLGEHLQSPTVLAALHQPQRHTAQPA